MALSTGETAEAPVGAYDAGLEITPNGYGFGGNWAVSVWKTGEGPREQAWFYLGQDIKVCRRLLGYSDGDSLGKAVLGEEHEGAMDLREDEVKHKLALYIVRRILGLYLGDQDGLDELFSQEAWTFAVE